MANQVDQSKEPDQAEPAVEQVAVGADHLIFLVNGIANSEKWADLTIICQNHCFKVHSAIVCPSCLYINECLGYGVRHPPDTEFDMSEAQPDMVHAFLSFLYTGEIRLGGRKFEKLNNKLCRPKLETRWPDSSRKNLINHLLKLVYLFAMAWEYEVEPLRDGITTIFRELKPGLLTLKDLALIATQGFASSYDGDDLRLILCNHFGGLWTTEPKFRAELKKQAGRELTEEIDTTVNNWILALTPEERDDIFHFARAA